MPIQAWHGVGITLGLLHGDITTRGDGATVGAILTTAGAIPTMVGDTPHPTAAGITTTGITATITSLTVADRADITTTMRLRITATLQEAATEVRLLPPADKTARRQTGLAAKALSQAILPEADGAADIPLRIHRATPADVERVSTIPEEALPARTCRPARQSTAGLLRIRGTTASRPRKAAAVATLPFRPEGLPSTTARPAEVLSIGGLRRQALQTAVLTPARKAADSHRAHTTALHAAAVRAAA